LKADKISVDCVVFTNDGQYLVTGGTDNAVKAWDLTRMQIDHVLQTHVGNITALAISPSGGLLAVGGTSNEVELWDNQNPHKIGSLHGHTHLVSSLAFSPDGRRVVTGSYDHTVRIWDVQTRNCETILENEGPVCSIGISADGNLLASGGEREDSKGEVIIWDLRAGHQRNCLTGHMNQVRAIAFSKDNKTIATGGEDLSVRLWSVETGCEVASLDGHIDDITCMAFSPDDNILATGSKDRTVRLWRVKTKSVANLLRTKGIVSCLAFRPDNHVLAVGSWGYGTWLGWHRSEVRLWDITDMDADSE
jgi:WD40 repeat protein